MYDDPKLTLAMREHFIELAIGLNASAQPGSDYERGLLQTILASTPIPEEDKDKALTVIRRRLRVAYQHQLFAAGDQEAIALWEHLDYQMCQQNR